MDIRKDHSTMTTMGGYALIAVVIGVWFYTSQQKEQKRRSHVIKQPTKISDRDIGADTKKKAEKPIKPKPKTTPAAASERSEPAVSKPEYNQEEVEIADKKADRDFARQLANTHAGTKFNNKKSDEKRQKSVKQSKAQEITSQRVSASSSTTGDADDDLSSQASPVVVAADNHGVADMLEPVAPGPSVLRLTDTDSAKKPKERKAKAPEPVETKKQRQNRKKAEAAKAAREEDEKERKVKLEQQRRTARIAEGRAAKDGSTFMNTQNAWAPQATDSSAPVQLLDTFERQPQSGSSKAPASASVAAAKKATSDPWSGLPSEEEQLEMIRQEDSWNEVKTKKKGKKKDAAAENSAAPTQSTNGNTTSTATANSKPANGMKKPVITSSSSSFAALTPEGAGDDDEAEQEWDV
ncbi:hypothetical protein SAMD00023353_0101680 [Rosellinia necatrix]|uniref:Uncharacterized protein n=1 Tax=Rosellinia necatrix TaxID=77044 RepID=A0A1S7UHJ3_ROSNE|nr:hypothetical protein SAMD00023353_0101680 [Rosellinia necatrix]